MRETPKIMLMLMLILILENRKIQRCRIMSERRPPARLDSEVGAHEFSSARNPKFPNPRKPKAARKPNYETSFWLFLKKCGLGEHDGILHKTGN